MPQKYSQSSFDDKENRPTQKAQLHQDHCPASLPTKKQLSRQVIHNQRILQPITSNQQFRKPSSYSSYTPAPPSRQPDNHSEKSLDPLQDSDIPYDHPPTSDIADVNPYAHQWTFAMPPKSVNEKAFSKSSQNTSYITSIPAASGSPLTSEGMTSFNNYLPSTVIPASPSSRLP